MVGVGLYRHTSCFMSYTLPQIVHRSSQIATVNGTKSSNKSQSFRVRPGDLGRRGLGRRRA